jgi:peroxiredoxin Q/BCP
MAAKKRPRKAVAAKARRKPAVRKKTRPAAKKQAGVRALPALKVETTGGKRLCLSELTGKRVVLYFYPKDDTPGCTMEGCDFRDRSWELDLRRAVVLGVSRDGIASHEKFKSKYNFPFELISDPDGKLCRAFGVIKQKTLYGRKHLGIERSTFVFDEDGKLRHAFRGVKVPGHVQQVIETLDRL